MPAAIIVYGHFMLIIFFDTFRDAADAMPLYARATLIFRLYL